jgi:DNA-binding NtrC family response regulator
MDLDVIVDARAQADRRSSFTYPKLLDLQPITARKVVLVVEDEPLMLGLLTYILGSENYELIAADRPHKALALVDGGLMPDLLITDLVMPEMTGVELSQKVRAVIPELPVLFETGHSSQLFLKNQELDARTAFIEKPFSARGLIEAARLVMFGTFNPGAEPC